jgi:hypothetical protein
MANDYPVHTAAQTAADIAPAGRRAVATGEPPPAQRAKRNPWKTSRILDSAPTGRRWFPTRRRSADRQRFLRPSGARRISISATTGSIRLRRIPPVATILNPSGVRSERAALGITVRDTEPLGGAGFQPANRPPTIHRLEAGATRVVTVDASQRLQHTIDFTDESTPTRRAATRPTTCCAGSTRAARPGRGVRG